MKLIFVTTCKPFTDSNSKMIQEQSILSWNKLNNYKNIEIKIIILGNEEGIQNFCDLNHFIYRNDFKQFIKFPYISEMLRIANEYANNDDVIIWCNSDIIFTNNLLDTILSFKNKINHNDYLLVGQRLDWDNYQQIELNKTNLNKIINDGNLHVPCGIDYLIHSKTSLINYFDHKLSMPALIADQRILSCALKRKIYTCNCTNTICAIHHNTGIQNRESPDFKKVKDNNFKTYGGWGNIKQCPFISYYNNKNIEFKKVPDENWYARRLDAKYKLLLKQKEECIKTNYLLNK